VALPGIDEQKRIASALSDVDALISSLDKLIAKKRDIKQAAMQQLLTGRRRLPGFKCTMERVRLGNIAQIVGGGTPRTGVAEYWDGEIRWCTPSDITACRGKYLAETTSNITYQGLKSSAAQLLPPGTLLLCSRATVGEVRIAATEICTNQGFKSLVCGDRVNNEYLYYAIPMMKPRMVEKASGSTFLELSKKDAESLELYLPPFDEQVAIASVFSDMDAEIEALERRRYKTRLLKQGMMQELLTGRVRLV
jgi:type I restriction enzyme S subunit